ncbi:phage head closure protein [Ignatzschineria rhizosphaerae]|uniref:Phage head closure protein n=1 Tax=Ignatzschineria rhizosphaerae TaxID=2923279 RepID=A0ABY3X066_9GAMM|nr:phage head closure protein [Ignatzschineria rhizosphaerae]UNM96294.1 phage head closure protein [Ignatzschineria rhizosphaerae]
MDFGRLKHRVTLQKSEVTNGPYGREEKWIDVGKLWAEIGSVSGKELIASGAELSSVSYKIIIRYRKDITAKHRLKYDDKIYNIEAVLPNNNRTMLTLLCEEGLEHDY